MDVFRVSLTKTPNVFTKAMFGLRVVKFIFIKQHQDKQSECLIRGVLFHVNRHATTHK
jgi:hypothetical protein